MLPQFNHDLYLSQFSSKMGRHQSKINYPGDSSPDSPESQLNGRAAENSGTNSAFGNMSEIRGPGTKDGIDYNFSIKLKLDDTMCGSSGAPFYI